MVEFPLGEGGAYLVQTFEQVVDEGRVVVPVATEWWCEQVVVELVAVLVELLGISWHKFG